MSAGDPEADSPTAAPDPAQTQAVFLVLTTAELKDSVAGIVESARYRVTTHPSLEGIRIVGPMRPSRTVGQWVRGSEDRESQSGGPCATAFPRLRQGRVRTCCWASPSSTASPPRSRIASPALRASPRLQALPLQIHGLSIDGRPDQRRSGEWGSRRRRPRARVTDSTSPCCASSRARCRTRRRTRIFSSLSRCSRGSSRAHSAARTDGRSASRHAERRRRVREPR